MCRQERPQPPTRHIVHISAEHEIVICHVGAYQLSVNKLILCTTIGGFEFRGVDPSSYYINHRLVLVSLCFPGDTRIAG